MIVLTILALLTIVFLFALSSISQSYASARQAQAVVETARAAEIAGINSLIAILLLALLMIIIIGIGIHFYLRFKTDTQQSPRQIIHPQLTHDGTGRLDNVLTLLAIQILHSQMEQNASQLYIPPAQVDDSTDDNDLWLLP